MTIYYEKLEDGTIGKSTPFKDVAKSFNLTLTTEEEIVYGYDGKRYLKGTEPTPPEPTYAEKRAAEYPSIAEQLDMIYWDKVNGTDNWQNAIAAVKEKYPKEVVEDSAITEQVSNQVIDTVSEEVTDTEERG